MKIEFLDDRDDPSLSSAVAIADLVHIAAATLGGEGLGADVEVAITLIDEAAMALLNATHLERPGPTDVLSFPLEELTPGAIPATPAGGPPRNIGDVFICPAVVADNANAAAVSFQDEMALMVVHGLLHLLGYDHIVDSEAEQMEQRERDLLAVVGRTRP
ncbi:rRNA maturation RNase YbeY [Actinomycetota bacterium]